MKNKSEIWSELSRIMYGEEFINELAELFKSNNISTILECGCGDGYILEALAVKGFDRCEGIDSSDYILNVADREKPSNVTYRNMDWRDLSGLGWKPDLIMNRGNSLASIGLTEKELITRGKLKLDYNNAKENIIKSIAIAFKSVKKGGMLYFDTTSKLEIEGKENIKIKHDEDLWFKQEKGNFIIHGTNLVSEGWIDNKLNHHIRMVYERINYKSKNSTSRELEDLKYVTPYWLFDADELETMIKKHNPSRVWRPKLRHEPNYDIVCAIK